MTHPHIPLARLAAAIVLATAGASAARAQDVPYSIGHWESDSTGNHRAVVRVAVAADAVRVHIPWRRRDQHPEQKRLEVVAAATGERVANVARAEVTREFGDVIFQPTAGAGDYWVYWMPYQGTFRSNYPRITYRPPDSSATADWLTRNQLGADGLRAGAWRTLPEAQVVALQSADSMSAMWPMETIATAEETRALLGRHPGTPYLLFPEDRTHPIRMTDDLPQRWVGVGPDGRDAVAGQPVTGEAQRGEFYAFQIGLWAATHAAESLAVRFTDLRRAPSADAQPRAAGAGSDRALIPASAFSSFNTQGVDWQGRAFARPLRVAQGKVQALWMGVMVPDSPEPGVYEGAVTIAPAGLEATTLPIRLTVAPRIIADHGDDEPWRLSRLRWLDSRLAEDTGLVRPYTPVAVDRARRSVSVLGRTVALAASGLPRQITSFFTEEMTGLGRTGRTVLRAPIRLVVEDSAGHELPWSHGGVRFTRQLPGAALWEATSAAGAAPLPRGGRSRAGAHGAAPPLAMRVAAEMDFDGNIEYAVALTAARATAVRDIRLEIPFADDVARYLMGMGRKGGARPDTMTWHWDRAKNQDAAWIGDVNAGLQFTLKDDRYVRPLNTNFYTLRPLVMPRSWENGGQGGCTFQAHQEAHDGGAPRTVARRTDAPAHGRTDRPGAQGGAYLVSCFSGARTIAAGDTLHFNVRLLLTPFHALDTRAQWTTRYFHAYRPVDTVLAAGANTINVHHATAINPYLNYPFLRPDAMRAYVDSAHAAGMRVKIYYTVRELTNRAPEFWALRSLGDEVFAGGPGGGHAWLQEHVGSDYITGWVVPELKDITLVTSGISRWHNFYIEGLDWLVRHVGIDGLYLDDVAFDRISMQRIRRVLDRGRPGALIDLHSANQYDRNDGFASSANLYLEHFPYLDRLWFGEYFDYNSPPDYWLTEMSGIPFGLMGEMLQDGGNPWRGMVFGMTARLPWAGDPRALWRAWDDFGMTDTRMIGWWVPGRPVRTGRDDVLATTYLRPGKAMIALASWARDTVDVQLTVDWRALGLDSARTTITAPAIASFQPAATFRPGEPIRVAPGKGWLLVIGKRDK
ncbi:MAG: glycoside hydrolase domain-containing protein [Gemmatimonadales bacterium]